MSLRLCNPNILSGFLGLSDSILSPLSWNGLVQVQYFLNRDPIAPVDVIETVGIYTSETIITKPNIDGIKIIPNKLKTHKTVNGVDASVTFGSVQIMLIDPITHNTCRPLDNRIFVSDGINYSSLASNCSGSLSLLNSFGTNLTYLQPSVSLTPYRTANGSTILTFVGILDQLNSSSQPGGYSQASIVIYNRIEQEYFIIQEDNLLNIYIRKNNCVSSVINNFATDGILSILENGILVIAIVATSS